MSVRGFEVPPRIVMLVSFGGTSVLNYAFGLIMGWLLLPGDFGWLAFAQTILLIAGLVLQSGFSWSLARAVVNADETRRDALVRGASLANCSFAVFLGLLLVVLFALGPLRAGLETWTVTVLVALSFPFIAFAAVARGCAQGSDRFGIVASLQATEIFCKVISGTGLVLAGFGVAGAASGFLIGASLAAALGLYNLARLGIRFWNFAGAAVELPALRVVGPMFGALLGLSLLLNLDLIGLKLLSAERALAGYYQAGLVLANAPYYLVMSALVPVLFVRLSRFSAVIPESVSVLGETLSLTLLLVAPMEVVLMLIPERMLLLLLPDAYAAGAPALRILATGNMLLMLTGILSAAFQAAGRAWIAALILLGTVALEPLALWAVVPRTGPVGAASVFVAASAVALVCLAATYAYAAGAASLRPAVPWLYRYVAAVGVGAVAGVGASYLGMGEVLSVLVGGTCYLFAALRLRLVRLPAMLGKHLPFLSPASSKE